MQRRWLVNVLMLFLMASLPVYFLFMNTGQALQVKSIQWNSYTERSFMRALSQKRLVLVYGYAPWCHFCQHMQSTWDDPSVVRMVQQNYVAIKVNVDTDGEIARRNNINTFPTIIIMDGNHHIISEYSGYMSPDSIIAKLQNALGR